MNVAIHNRSSLNLFVEELMHMPESQASEILSKQINPISFESEIRKIGNEYQTALMFCLPVKGYFGRAEIIYEEKTASPTHGFITFKNACGLDDDSKARFREALMSVLPDAPAIVAQGRATPWNDNDRYCRYAGLKLHFTIDGCNALIGLWPT